jgi:hypothetical protein
MDGGEAAAHEAIEASPSWRARSGRLAGWRLAAGLRPAPAAMPGGHGRLHALA